MQQWYAMARGRERIADKLNFLSWAKLKLAMAIHG